MKRYTFEKHLPEVRERGCPFVIQYAVTGYPKELEHSVVDATRAIESLKRAAMEFGPEVCVWRYDTIVFSSITPWDFHLRQFELLAASLEGSTNEVVISFAQLYSKTCRNMDKAASQFGFTWSDPPEDEKRELAERLAEIAASHAMAISMCAQPELVVPGVGEARCIDAERLSRVAGRYIKAPLKGGRKTCGCHQSRDIGEYDTCPHGCVYCYAVRNRELARGRFREHDPESEFLVEPPEATGEDASEPKQKQRFLFPEMERGAEDDCA